MGKYRISWDTMGFIIRSLFYSSYCSTPSTASILFFPTVFLVVPLISILSYICNSSSPYPLPTYNHFSLFLPLCTISSMCLSHPMHILSSLSIHTPIHGLSFSMSLDVLGHCSYMSHLRTLSYYTSDLPMPYLTWMSIS